MNQNSFFFAKSEQKYIVVRCNTRTNQPTEHYLKGLKIMIYCWVAYLAT